mgnify:CR=1 FL=1
MERKNTDAVVKKRMNVIDVLILILLVVCIAGLVVRFGNFGSVSSSENLGSYDIYFSVSNIAYTSEDAFVQGDTVTLADSGTALGEFAGLETILPAEFFARDKSGNLIVVNYPQSTRIDVTGRILSHGVMSENGYLVGGTTYVAPGTEYTVQSEHMDFVLKITNIVEK